MLHYAASSRNCSIRRVLTVLFTYPNLDFTVKDNQNNTPLHVAALCCEDRTTYNDVLPMLLAEAGRRGFNFSTLGQNGQSVLHISARISFTEITSFSPMFGQRKNNVRNVLEKVANPGLNLLSLSGATAFFYAISHCHIEEANALLNAGADPSLCGSPEKDPFSMIDEQFLSVSDILNGYIELHAEKITDGQAIAHYTTLFNDLYNLKERMLSILTEKSAHEVRKNAKMILQGARRNFTFFNGLPFEIQTKIAGLTATNGVHTQAAAEKIAAKNLNNQVSSYDIHRCAYPLSI